MRQAQRVDAEAAPPLEHEQEPSRSPKRYESGAAVLDESCVLEVLETDFVDEEEVSRAISGIRNGVLLGTAFWILVMLALAGFGYV